MLLGNFLAKAGRRDGGDRRLPPALALDPEHQRDAVPARPGLQGQGRLDDARVGFERARALDPRNGKVLWQLADLRHARGPLDARPRRS